LFPGSFPIHSEKAVVGGVLMAVDAGLDLASGSHGLAIGRHSSVDPAVICVLGLGVEFQHDEQTGPLAKAVYPITLRGDGYEVVPIFGTAITLRAQPFLLGRVDFLWHPGLLDDDLPNGDGLGLLRQSSIGVVVLGKERVELLSVSVAIAAGAEMRTGREGQ